MKPLSLGILFWPVLASAQATPSEIMRQGIIHLAQATTVTITTTGSEYRGNKPVTIRVTAAFYNNWEHNDIRLEVLTYEDGKLKFRQAADGVRLWDYDVRENTYSSSNYCDNSSVLFPNWRQRVFQTLRNRTTGATAFTLRFLDDAFGPGFVSGTWISWIPTAKLSRVDSDVIAMSDSPNKNSTTYYLDGHDDSGFNLLGADFIQQSSNGREEKNYQTIIETGKLPVDTDFRFVPPRGSKVHVVESRQGI